MFSAQSLGLPAALHYYGFGFSRRKLGNKFNFFISFSLLLTFESDYWELSSR